MIKFVDVNKSFAGIKVLDQMNLHIPRRRITFIIGKSGEGKSVTIKHMIGLLRPQAGEIYVDGQEITGKDHREMRLHRKQFGMLFQHSALFDSMDILANVTFPLKEHSLFSYAEMRDKAEESLQRVGLQDVLHRLPSELSTGEKKRVGLARALVTEPKILLYDEPTTGMDPLISEMIDELIVKINNEIQEVTSVVISHDIKATLATADKIIMIYQGKVILEGDPQTFTSTDNLIVQQFLAGRTDGPMEFF